MLARSIVSLSALLIIISMAAFGQVAAAAGSISTPFADDSGFSVFLPQGWIGEDIDNTSPSSQSAESRLGYGLLAIFRPQQQAFPQIDSSSICESAEDSAYVFRYGSVRT